MRRNPTPDMDRIAGVLDRRAEAVIIDGLIVLVAVVLFGFGAGTLAGDVSGFGGSIVAMMFGMPVGLLIYMTSLEGYYGRTLGKRARGIVVVKSDGSDCTWGAAILRNLLRVVDVLPNFYIVGIATAYLAGDQRRLGDLAAGTLVVHERD